MTAPFDTSKFLIEQGPVNWSDPLTEYYAERSKQLELSLRQWESHRQQKVEVADKQSLIKLATAFGKAGSSLAQGAAAIKKANDLQEVKNTAVFNNKWAQWHRAPDAFETQQKIFKGVKEWEAETGKSIFDNIKNYKQLIASIIPAYEGEEGYDAAKSKDLLPARVAYDELNKDTFVLVSQYQALKHTGILTPQHFKNALWLDSDLKEKYEALGPDPISQQNFFKNWQIGELSIYAHSDGLISATVLKELGRQANTRQGMQRSKTATSVISEKSLRFKEQIEQFSNLNDGGYAIDNLSNAVERHILQGSTEFADIKEGETAIQQSTDRAVGWMAELAANGRLDIPALFAGKSRSHPDGLTFAAAYLNEDQKKHLMEAWTAGAQARVNGYFQQGEALAIQDMDELRQGNTITSQAQWDARVLLRKGQVSAQTHSRMSNMTVAAQRPDQFTIADTHYTNLDTKGLLHTKIEELSNHKNINIQKKWLPKALRINEYITNNPTAYNESILEKSVYELRTGESLNQGGSLSSEDDLVAARLKEFTRVKLYEYLAQEESTGQKLPIASLLVKDRKDFFEANGGGIIANQNEPKPQGMFAMVRDGLGKASWVNIVDANIERQPVSYRHDISNPNRELNYNSIKKQYPKREDRHAVEGGLYSKEQILGWRESGGRFSEDMKWIASEEGLLPGTALELAVAALIKADPDFAARHNLTGWVSGKGKNQNREAEIGSEERPVELGAALIESIRRAKGTSKEAVFRKVRSVLTHQGWDYLSPKDRNDLYEILAEVSPITEGLDPIKAKDQQLRAQGYSEEDIVEWWKLYNDTKFKERVEEGALDLQNIPIG